MVQEDAPLQHRNQPRGEGRGVVRRAGVAALITLLVLGAFAWRWSLGIEGSVPKYNAGSPREGLLPPWWWPWGVTEDQARRFNDLIDPAVLEEIARRHSVDRDALVSATRGAAADELRSVWPRYWMGTDVLGRSVLVRMTAGGFLSLLVGVAAALVSVVIGTVYGLTAAYAGGWIDALLMRIVDVLYSLPYVLLVVLLAVAVGAVVERAVLDRVARAQRQREAYVERQLAQLPPTQRSDAARERFSHEAMERIGDGELSLRAREAINIGTLLIAIGAVSWLTVARVVRGQVLRLRHAPFVEASRVMGGRWWWIMPGHLLPNLAAPVLAYAALTVPQAMLEEAFLSFLGIGVQPPMPSLGSLAAEGLAELNPYESHGWLLLFPCLALGGALLLMNAWGEALRRRFDPKASAEAPQ